MRITVNGQRADASVKRFVAPRLWNTAKGKAVENGRGCRELNLYLDAVCRLTYSVPGGIWSWSVRRFPRTQFLTDIWVRIVRYVIRWSKYLWNTMKN